MILFKKKEAKEVKPEYKFYRSIDSLPFWNYEKIVSSGDLRHLLILNYYDELPVLDIDENIWDNIQMQIFEASGSQRSKNYILELSHILRLRREYLILSNATFCLCYKKDIELIEILNNKLKKYNPKFEFKHNSDNEYYNSIIECDRQIKGIKANIEAKELDFSKKYKTKSGKIDLYKAFDNICRHYKIQFDPRTLSTRRFFEMNQTMHAELKENGKREA